MMRKSVQMPLLQGSLALTVQISPHSRYSRPSSCPIPMLCPIIWAMVPARRCGSYAFMSTLMPTDLAVQTVSGTAIPDFPPWNDVSPLQDKDAMGSEGRQVSDYISNLWFCISQHKLSTCHCN